MKRRISETFRDGNTLVKVACDKCGPNLWNLAIVAAKSKRELNDFIYGSHRNPRRRRLMARRQSVSFRTLIQCNKFVRRMTKTLPDGHWLQSRPDWDDVEVLSKWMQRLGFTPYTVDGTLIYLLRVRRTEEA